LLNEISRRKRQIWPKFEIVNKHKLKRKQMLKWTATFLVIALIAALLGFTGIAEGAASIAKIIFFIFLILLVGSLILGATIFKK
jgi:uncharacterized membrane protein YtjA (UPF0391 family)